MGYSFGADEGETRGRRGGDEGKTRGRREDEEETGRPTRSVSLDRGTEQSGPRCLMCHIFDKTVEYLATETVKYVAHKFA